MTASVFIISNVLKNTSNPAYVKRKFPLAKFTTWLHYWNRFLKLNLIGKFFARTFLTSRILLLHSVIPASLLIRNLQLKLNGFAASFGRQHVDH